MDLEKNIQLDRMMEDAKTKFSESNKRLEELDYGFRSKMGGRSMSSIGGAFIGTTIWLVVFAVFLVASVPYANPMLLMIAAISLVIFIVLMYIDDVVNYKFYNGVSMYGANITQLKSRIKYGYDSMNSNMNEFKQSKQNGWNYKLNVGKSIPDEIAAIEDTMSSMESLKKGFVSSAKTFMFYATAIMITIVGGFALRDVALGIVDNFDSSAYGVANVVGYVMLVVACIAEYLLAKYVWGRTNCDVTNLTIAIILAGPVIFVIGTVLGVLAVALIVLLLQIAVGLIALFCVGSTICGG